MNNQPNPSDGHQTVAKQAYAFAELCPICHHSLALLVKVINAESIDKSRWCTFCEVEVKPIDVEIVNVDLKDDEVMS